MLTGQSEQFDGGDGYLSDVPTQASNVPSEDASHDLIFSARMLEQSFKDRYRVLRAAYEQRIRQLSDVIQDACAALFSDELLNEMKSDKTTSAFIPAHLSELLDRHLQSERERYIHQILTHMSIVDVDLAKAKEKSTAQQQRISKLEAEVARGRRVELSMEPLKEKLSTAERELEEIKLNNEDLRQTIGDLRHINTELEGDVADARQQLAAANADLEALARECDALRATNENQTRDIRTLENTFEQSARDLAAIEAIDKQEKAVRDELHAQLLGVTEQRDVLLGEVQDLTGRLRLATEEIARLEAAAADKAVEDEANRQKMAAVMAQVENMLAQEAAESNAAIVAIHEKSKQTRQRLTLELQKERRINGALQDELAVLRATRDEKARELRNLVEDDTKMREKLNREQQRNAALQIELQEAAAALSDARSKALDADLRARQAEERKAFIEERLTELERSREQQIQQIEERARAKAQQEMEQERQRIDLKTSAYRLQYQNELGALQNQLRHSYTMGTNSLSDMSVEFALKAARDGWLLERTRMEAQHSLTVSNLKSQMEAMESQFQLAASAAAAKHEAEHQQTVSALQARLLEADDVIEKLKQMVRDNRTLLETQKRVFEEQAAAALDSHSEAQHLLQRELLLQQQQVDQQRQLLQLQQQQIQHQGHASQPHYESHKIQSGPKPADQHEPRNQEHIGDASSAAALINNARRETRDAMEKAHAMEIEVMRLKQQLSNCQEQALRDQAQDAKMLNEMKMKLASLMSSYERERGDASMLGSAARPSISTQSSQLSELDEEERSALTSRIRGLEQAVGLAQAEVEFERNQGLASRRRAQELYELLRLIETKYKTQVRALQAELSNIRDKVQQLGPALASEAMKVAQGVEIKSQAILEKVEHMHKRQLQQTRIALAKAHEVEKQHLEAGFSGKIASESSKHERALQEAKRELIRRADSALGLSVSSPGRGASAITAVDASGTSDASTFAIARASAYESVTRGMLDALTSSGILPDEAAAKINSLALANEQPSFAASTEAKAVLSEHLDKFIADMQNALAELDSLRDRLFREGIETEGSVETASSRALDAAVGELEQSRHENALLVDITKMEAESKLKSLQQNIADLQRMHEIELARIRAESLEQENALRASLTEQLTGLRGQEDARVASLENKLASEQNKRQNLLRQLTEMDRAHRIALEELEGANAALEQRAERAELQLTKLRMEQAGRR